MPGPIRTSPLHRRGRGVVIGTAVALGFVAFFYLFGGWSLAPQADLTLCNGDEPQTLDPAQITGQLEGRIALALFEGLTTRAPSSPAWRSGGRSRRMV
jgi:ABC-type oligopeptide transport system substrate-binding subunit